MCNFHYLGYCCSPNLSIHQNSTQELTWNFLVTLAFIKAINVAEGEKIKITVLQNQMDFFLTFANGYFLPFEILC